MNIAVIGAGAAGLTAAWELAKAGQGVTLIEASPHVGGLAAGFQLPGWDWPLEKFYHHWFSTDTDILELINEIGCRDRLMFSRPKSAYWIDGESYTLNRPLDALRLPISLASKLRMALAGIYLKLPLYWQSLDHISAYDWLHRTMGTEVYEKLWAAVLEGKFKDTYREVPLSWLWAHVYNRSAEIAVYEGGFQALWDHLAQLLHERGVNLLLNIPINALSPEDSRLAMDMQGETRFFDAVVSTLSPQAMLKITPALGGTDYARQMLSLRSVGAVGLILSLRQSLLPDGTYSMTLPSETQVAHGFPFTNLLEHTNLVSRDHYGGDHLVYCVEYVSDHQSHLEWDDKALFARFTDALPRLNPNFSEDWVRDWWLFRTPVAQPIPLLNAGKSMPALRTPLPGVYWITMSHMHPWGKGTNFAVRLGRQVARMLMLDT